ncbi:DUF1697 domain-containing protein [bacterium RCC_150]
MNSFAVFLRGINVGGINIKMADLKSALSAYPFTGVKTLLASGNVVLQSELDAAGVKEEFEKCLRAAFGYEAWVVVLTAKRVGELVDACPYPADDKANHSYVTLASNDTVLDELFKAADDLAKAGAASIEHIRLGPEATAWLAPVGGTLENPLSKLAAKPRYKSSITTRNLRTLIKVRDAAAALEERD